MNATPKKRVGLKKKLDFLKRAYATADPRSLGLFRIALGTLLFWDVWRRAPDLVPHYTNAGWFTNHYALFRPMSDHFFSLYAAFGPPGEVKVLFALHLLVNLALIVGWHTRVAQVLAAVLITSLNSRAILLENGGWVVVNLITVWSVFLPLGERFSLDALRSSLRKYRDVSPAALNDVTFVSRTSAPVVSLAVAALILQWGIIYYFNVVHKRGEPWQDGTAVYYFLHLDRMLTPLGSYVREWLPLGAIKLMTWSTLVIEASVAVLILLPFSTDITRMIAWALVCMLHLSIDLLVQLGPFSWVMTILFFSMTPARFWGWLGRRGQARKPERRLLYDAEDGASIALCRLLRRADGYGRVQFVPLGAADASVTEHGTEPAERLALAHRTLVVTDAGGAERWSGAIALVRLADALPLGFLARILAVPGVRNVADGLIGFLLKRRQRLSARLQLADLARASDERPSEPSGAERFWARLRSYFVFACVSLLLIAGTSQIFVENNVLGLVPYKRAAWIDAVIVYPRLFQGWSMFAPQPPTDDGHLVVDGRTANGEKFDPLTGREPDFAVYAERGFRLNQIWGDFHNRVREERFSAYWPGVEDYLLRHHELTGRTEEKLSAFDVWWVYKVVSPPGEPPGLPQRRKLFSHGVVQ
ncbi:MAG TPA: HTTM domain-containing protein [Polyangiaceae bacterium]|nr:HTTM domain-containing protein [Polyangiaceae bacterium]